MIKFGPSGNSEEFYSSGYKKTEDSAPWLKSMGVDVYEYSFGRGVTISDEKAEILGDAFGENGIELTVHAPYFINFANPDEEMALKSYNYVLQSAAKMKLMKGNRVVFHPSTQGKLTREDAVNLTKERLKRLCEFIYLNGYENMYFCPETMGKLAQIGTIEEITDFCKIDKVFLPTVDFGHVNAREQGSLKTAEDYKSRLEYMIAELGYERMKHFHVHFSKIQYTGKGEVRHLTFEDKTFGPEFAPLAATLKELKLEPVVICESAGTQLKDAMEMKRIYFECHNT